jgi:hypothetical protein
MDEDTRNIPTGCFDLAHIILSYRHKYTYLSPELRERTISEKKQKLMEWLKASTDDEVEAFIARVRKRAKTLLPDKRLVDTYPEVTA